MPTFFKGYVGNARIFLTKVWSLLSFICFELSLECSLIMGHAPRDQHYK